jgi:hypothetical protein
MPLDVRPGTPFVRVYSVKHLDSLIQREKHIFQLIMNDRPPGPSQVRPDGTHEVVMTVRPKGFFASWSAECRQSDFGYELLSRVLGDWKGKYDVTVYCFDPDWSAHEIAQEILEWGT